MTKKRTSIAKPSSTSTADSELFEALQVGHHPSSGGLSASERAIFQAFQANLLSLISHELKTPVMGIKNALTLLEGELSATASALTTEAFRMASSNVDRLEKSLRTLLDLAAIESRAFRIRLREVNGARLLQGWVGAPERKVKYRLTTLKGAENPILADPDKMKRALDRLEGLSLRWLETNGIELRVSSAALSLHAKLKPGHRESWEEFWAQGMAGFQGGVYSPTSVFSGVLQAEQAFLARSDDEGLGSELVLIHQILRSQEGSLAAERMGDDLSLHIKFKLFNFQDGLPLALQNRIDQLQLDQEDGGSFALVALRPGSDADPLPESEVRQQLFRSRDVVFRDVETGQYLLLVDELALADIPRFMARLEQSLSLVARRWKISSAIYPGDGTRPELLLQKL